MKAVKLFKSGSEQTTSLEFVNLEAPKNVGKGEIKVKVYASSLNYHDLGVMTGNMPSENGRIPLADCSGIVEKIGTEVTEFKIGDHVISTFFPNWLDGTPNFSDFSCVPGDGIDGFAQEVVIKPATAFTLAPKKYSHLQASTLTTAGLTAWRALIAEGHLKANETVLIQGTGGVSIFALQIAKALGCKVIATSSSHEKLERLKQLGADQVIHYKEVTDWSSKVLELTDGKGVDHVVEVGGANTFEQSCKACKVGGHIALIGVLTGIHASIQTLYILMKQLRINGILVGSRKQQQDFVAAIQEYDFYPVIDKVFAFNDLRNAVQYQITGQHFGKICIEY
ncbi:NAD(P)-dependent alcohol dehydrogenase [Acinetobacter sp. WU_MDCI_Axc73]|nr:NAD(P)-dependent alcohol dehydrogenase [Acinetobacter sp. WU_MDCI_Axc73]